MRSRRFLGWIALTAFTVLATVRLLTPREPHYHGKPLSAWVKTLHPSGQGYDPESPERQRSIHDESVEAMRAIGTNALPFLLCEIRVRDWPGKQEVVRLVERQTIVRFHWASASERRLRAVSGFAALGAEGRTAVPALLDLFAGDGAVAACASSAVVSIGVDAVPPLILALTNASPGVRCRATAALGYFHAQAEAAIPVLLTLMQDDDSSVRVTVASSLGHIGCRPEAVVPALIRGLDDPSSSVRDNCALALGRFGPMAGSATPALQKLVRDRRDPMGDAARALARVNPETAEGDAIR